MDELWLINELVDSDDDMHLEPDLIFNDFSTQHAASLLKLLERDTDVNRSVPDTPIEEDRNREEDKLPPNFNTLEVDTQILYDDKAVSYTEEEFLQLFRVKPSLVEHMTKFLCQESASYPDFEVLPEQQILATLFFLGQEKTAIEDVCDRFNISFLTCTQILNRVTSAVSSLSHTAICLPQNDQQKENTKAFYAQNHSLRGVVGCIDTLPVEVTQSKKEEKSANSSQELFILQAAVNENEKFIHIYVSNNAGTDEEILEKSKFCDKMASFCSEKEYFLGGATYACREQLLTPYPDSEDISGDEIFFNLSVAACMSSVDAAFTGLTQRFRSLLGLQLPNVAIANQVITACCVVHNMADKADFNEPFVAREANIQGYSRVNSQTFQDTCEGLLLRNEVCTQLM